MDAVAIVIYLLLMLGIVVALIRQLRLNGKRERDRRDVLKEWRERDEKSTGDQ